MSDEVKVQPSLDAAAGSFLAAERELRSVMERAQKLSSAKEELAAARGDLEASQRALADTSSAIYGLATELKDIARDMKDSATVLRRVEPDRINQLLKDVLASHRRLRLVAYLLMSLIVIGGGVAASYAVGILRL